MFQDLPEITRAEGRSKSNYTDAVSWKPKKIETPNKAHFIL